MGEGYTRDMGKPRALWGASESSCGQIPRGATRNVTPTRATGLAAGAAKAQEAGPTEAALGQELAKQVEARRQGSQAC